MVHERKVIRERERVVIVVENTPTSDHEFQFAPVDAESVLVELVGAGQADLQGEVVQVLAVGATST